MIRIDEEDIALRRGRSFNTHSAIDHAELASPCDVNEARVRLDEEAVELRSGWCMNLRTDHDHAEFAILCWVASDIVGRAAADSAFRSVKC